MLAAFARLARTEGILCAFESAHALAWVDREAPSLAGQTVLVCLSGRGDKDVAQAMELLDDPAYLELLDPAPARSIAGR